jgi:hypothetical protein
MPARRRRAHLVLHADPELVHLRKVQQDEFDRVIDCPRLISAPGQRWKGQSLLRGGRSFIHTKPGPTLSKRMTPFTWYALQVCGQVLAQALQEIAAQEEAAQWVLHAARHLHQILHDVLGRDLQWPLSEWAISSASLITVKECASPGSHAAATAKHTCLVLT